MSADFTIADVLAWARTKPADEQYNYGSNHACALCQFLGARKIAFRSVGGENWSSASGECVPFPDGLAYALVGAANHDSTLKVTEWNFGALVRRLEELCPDTPVTPSNWQSIDAYLTDIEDVARERVSA